MNLLKICSNTINNGLFAVQDRAMISKDKISFELSSLNEETGIVLNQHVSSNNNNSSRYYEEVSDRRKEEQLHLDESGSKSKTTLKDNLNSLSCVKDSDIFKQHLCSLSSTHKVSVACNG